MSEAHAVPAPRSPPPMADAVTHAALGTVEHGVIILDGGGRVLLADPSASRLLAFAGERSFGALVSLFDDPDAIAPSLATPGGPVTLALRRDPARWFALTTVRAESPPDAGSTPSPALDRATILTVHEVTEARRQEHIRETFIGVLSHELRTPVTTIFGGAKVLARPDSTLDDATRREIFIDIADEAERLQRLVEDIVALNRFGDADGDLGPEPVLLQRVVPAVVASERSRWPAVEFVTRIPVGVPTVVGDATYIEQVVRNLLANAAKYGGAGTTVETIVEPTDGEVAVRILDDGPGIAADEAGHLFELFYRSPDTPRDPGGAGIGLFVCARLVAAMGGRIWARPRPAGGSEFGFALRTMGEE